MSDSLVTVLGLGFTAAYTVLIPAALLAWVAYKRNRVLYLWSSAVCFGCSAIVFAQIALIFIPIMYAEGFSQLGICWALVEAGCLILFGFSAFEAYLKTQAARGIAVDTNDLQRRLLQKMRVCQAAMGRRKVLIATCVLLVIVGCAWAHNH